MLRATPTHEGYPIPAIWIGLDIQFDAAVLMANVVANCRSLSQNATASGPNVPFLDAANGLENVSTSGIDWRHESCFGGSTLCKSGTVSCIHFK